MKLARQDTLLFPEQKKWAYNLGVHKANTAIRAGLTLLMELKKENKPAFDKIMAEHEAE